MAHQRVVGARGPRRKMLWLDFAGVLQDVVVVAGGAVTLLSSLNAAALALRPFTIVRTRGIAMVSTDQTAATEFPMGALGFGIASEQAVAAGIGSLPTPVAEAGSSSWFMWQALLSQLNLSTAVGVANAGNVFAFDSKGQRKVELGDDIYVAVENESTTDGLALTFMARVLIKTH